MIAETIVTYVLSATVTALAAVAVYLGWRGRVFQLRPAEKPSRPTEDGGTDAYLANMAGVLRAQEELSPAMGSSEFDDNAYQKIVERLDDIQPPSDSEYAVAHTAYRDAVDLVIETRRRTVRHIRENGSRMTTLSGYPVADCLSGARARDLMLTYRRSVDDSIETLLHYCESEKAAIYVMQEQARASKWKRSIQTGRARI